MNWSRTIRRAILIVLASTVILAGLAYLAVHTKPSEHFILTQVVRVAEARTGARIRIRRLTIPWTHLGANLYGITIYGKGGTSNPPLFQSPHLEVMLNLASLLLGRVGINSLVLDRPVIHFTVDRKGQTNLPGSPAATKLSAPVSRLLNLAVGHMAINNGQIYCNDRKISLSATLSDFGVRVKFDKHSGEYRGSLGYQHGRIILGKFSPVQHSLQVRFLMNRTGLTLDPLRVSMRKSRFNLNARLVDFANPSLQGHFEAALYAQEFAQILRSSLHPTGEIMMSGTMQYRSRAGRSFLDNMRVDGRIHSPRLELLSSQAGIGLDSVRGMYAFDQSKLKVTNLQADTLDGSIDLKSAVLDLTGPSSFQLSAAWQGLSLQDATSALHSSKYRRLHFLGRTDGNVKMAWSNSISNLVAQTHVKLYQQARTDAAGTGIPLNGIVNVRYNAPDNSVFFGRSRLRIGNARLSLNGRMSRQSNLNVRLATSNLQDLSSLFRMVEAAKFGKALPSMPSSLQGSAEFAGHVTGSPQSPRIEGRFSAHDLQVEGTQWRSIMTDVDLSPSQIALKNAVMVAKGRGEFHVNATAGLQRWSITNTSPVSVEATAASLQVANLERLAKLNFPVKGILSASISVQGTAENPSGQGTVRIVKVSAWNQPIKMIAIELRGNGKSVHSTARIETAAGDLNADLTYVPQSRQYELAAVTFGLQLDRLQAVKARGLGIKGMLEFRASGRGTIANPELSADFAIAKLQVRGQSISGLQGKVNIANHHANFTTQLALDRGTVKAKGQVALAGEYDATATINANRLATEPLLTHYLKATRPGLKGVADIHAKVSGPLKDPARIEASVEVPKLNLAYQETHIALVRPLRIVYRNGMATLQRAELKGAGTDFTLQGTIPFERHVSMNVALNGTVDLGSLRAMTTGINASGRLQVQLAARGNLSHPKMEGSIRIEKAQFSSASMPVELDNVNGQIRVSGDRFEIQSLTGGANGGKLAVQGFMIYGTHPRFNLAMTANSVSVPYPQGVRTVVNCFLQFSGTKANSLLSGRVMIDQLLLTRQFELASLMGQFASGSSSPTPSPFEKRVKLDVVVQSAQSLQLASSQLSAQGAADLTLTGSLANPVVLGRATLEQGEIFFLNRRYEIQSGTFEFSNPMRTSPIVNLYVTTTVHQYKITMNFDGPINRMITSYTSDPPLPPSDIINLIALGSTPQQAGAGPVAPGVLGAESVLAKGVASQVTGKIEKLAGISQLTINPLVGNGQQNPGAQVSIQQRVTGRLLLTFSTATNETQDTAVQLQYKLSHAVSISALRGQYGGYAIGIHLHKSF